MTLPAEIPEPGQLSLFELADVANREHDLCRTSAYSMVEHAMNAGQALIEAKGRVPHGEWLPWLAENFEASERTAQNYMTVAANPQRAADLDTANLSMRGVLKRLERVLREDAPEEGALLLPAVDGVDIRHGDLRTVLDDLTGQVDVIITDPPYPAEFLDEFDALGELAARLLVPDGLLVAMVGQTHLPEYIMRLGAHISYRWCGAYLTDGPATRVFGRDVGTKWKPLLIFGGSEFITQDVFKSRVEDKEHHYWGQSESGMADIIERLTSPGQLVVDPFLGGGTTAVVCRDLGRRFVGCDTDAQAVATTHKRLNNK
jgi:site-specific DNA-methyltransferase (adenine-specific)